LGSQLPAHGIGLRLLDEFIGEPSHRHLTTTSFMVEHAHQKAFDHWGPLP
jgi:hypothetical protein